MSNGNNMNTIIITASAPIDLGELEDQLTDERTGWNGTEGWEQGGTYDEGVGDWVDLPHIARVTFITHEESQEVREWIENYTATHPVTITHRQEWCYDECSTDIDVYEGGKRIPERGVITDLVPASYRTDLEQLRVSVRAELVDRDELTRILDRMIATKDVL